jgi:peroxiredoxin
MKYTFHSLISAIFFVGFAPLHAQESGKSIDMATGLSIGAVVENFTAVDHTGKEVKLYDILRDGPVVLLFYRGNWCPVCNRHLSELEENLDHIYKKGARVIAVSPEKPELMTKTVKKTKASFTLLYDKDYHISEAFEVAYIPEKPLPKRFSQLSGEGFAKAQVEESEKLPIPATFIIDTSGKIVWRHVDSDYKNRASAQDIAQALTKF